MDIDILKRITGDSFSESIYRFAANEAEEIVKNYCNISEIPCGLINTTVRIAADILRFGQYGQSGGNIPTVVSSVTVGDTSTSFSPLTNNETDEVIVKYTKALNRYRRVTFD